jgi:hypothetical protein
MHWMISPLTGVPLKGRGGREVLYSDRAWQQMLEGLGSYPFAVKVMINELDSRGFRCIWARLTWAWCVTCTRRSG